MMVSNAGERIFELVDLVRRVNVLHGGEGSGDLTGDLRNDINACLGKYPPGEQIVFDAEHARDKARSDLAEAKAVIAPLRVELENLRASQGVEFAKGEHVIVSECEHNPAPKPKPGWSTVLEAAKATAGGITTLSKWGGYRYMADVNIACATAICMAVEANGEKLTP